MGEVASLTVCGGATNADLSHVRANAAEVRHIDTEDCVGIRGAAFFPCADIM